MSDAVLQEAPAADGPLSMSIARSFLPRWIPDAAIRQAPVGLVLAVQAVISISLFNYAWVDEALYIFGGHREIDHLLDGTDISQYGYGAYFSGAPALYPVLAAMLDHVGGLGLVRLFSTVCMLTSSVSVYVIGKSLFGRQAGFLGLCTFAVAGPILFLGHYATYDALTVALLAAGGAVLTRYAGPRSAILAGALLSLAIAVKYAGALWVPSVILLGVLAHRHGPWRQWLRPTLSRALITLGTIVVLIGIALAVWGQLVWQGIIFTTTARVAQIPVSDGYLLNVVFQDVGLPLGVAITGAVVLIRFRVSWFTAVVLLGSALLAPVHQIQINELAALHKHVGFGLIFAAPLAGYALVQITRWSRFYGTIVVSLVLLAMLVTGSRAGAAIMDIPKVNQPLLDEIRALTASPLTADNRNVLIAVDADTFMYYQQDDDPQISWYGDSSAARIHDGAFSIIAVNNIITNIPLLDARSAKLNAAVASTPGYRLVYMVPLRPGYKTLQWSVYIKT